MLHICTILCLSETNLLLCYLWVDVFILYVRVKLGPEGVCIPRGISTDWFSVMLPRAAQGFSWLILIKHLEILVISFSFLLSIAKVVSTAHLSMKDCACHSLYAISHYVCISLSERMSGWENVWAGCKYLVCQALCLAL